MKIIFNYILRIDEGSNPEIWKKFRTEELALIYLKVYAKTFEEGTKIQLFKHTNGWITCIPPTSETPPPSPYLCPIE